MNSAAFQQAALLRHWHPAWIDSLRLPFDDFQVRRKYGASRNIEAFNGLPRCLNAHLFLTLDDARSKMEDWRKYYNEVRPHGAIGNKPPITLQDYEGVPSSPS